MSRAAYAGSFDPITRGHLDIVDQALKVFDKVVIGIGQNAAKQPRFDLDERQRLIKESIEQRWETDDRDRISVVTFSRSIIDFAKDAQATAIVRGLRQVSDFADEFRMNGIVSRSSDIPMVYFICRAEFLHVASSTVKEMAELGLPIGWLVTPAVEAALKG